MVPSAVDNLSLALPELPIPSAAPSRAADRSDGNSFQDALARAGGNDRSDSSASTDGSRAGAANPSATSSSQGPQAKGGSQSADDSQATNQAAGKQSAARASNESQNSDQTKADDADDVDQGTPPIVTDEKKDDSSDHEEEQEPDQAALALAVLAAAQAQAKASAVPDDEVTLSDAAKDQAAESVAAAKPVAVRTDVPATIPVAPKSQKPTDDTATTVAATEQVAAPEVTAGAAPVVTDVPADSDGKPKTSSAASATVAEKTKDARLVQAASATEKSVAGADATSSTSASAVAASAALPEEEPSTDKRSDRGDDKALVADRSVGTTTIAATELPASQQTASGAVQAADTAVAAATSDRSDASGDTGRTADSGRQAEVTGLRHPAADAPRNANNRGAAATTGTLGEQAGAGGLSQGDRVRLVQRVARAVQTAQERGGDLQLRLSPPELGSLRLQVKMTDGALSARLEAETPQARQVLADSLPQLRERLAEQNIRVERFDVDLMQSGGGGPSNLPDRRQDASQDGSSSRGGATLRREAGGETSVGVSSPTRFVAAGRLDIVA